MPKDDYLDKMYNQLVERAKKANFTEDQLLFMMAVMIDVVSPSLVDLQEQINILQKMVVNKI